MHGVKNNVVWLTVPWCRVNESNGGRGGVRLRSMNIPTCYRAKFNTKFNTLNQNLKQKDKVWVGETPDNYGICMRHLKIS